MNPPLPAAPGTYALLLHLNQATSLQVGRLGDFHFPAGFYAYVGSAFGPGGLHARLRHHLQSGRAHWHVDYLRRLAQVHSIYFALTLQPQECLWSQALANLPHAWLPAPGFGASDCRNGCPTHLIGLSLEERSAQAQVQQALEGLSIHLVQVIPR